MISNTSSVRESLKRRDIIFNIFVYTLLVIFALIVIFPFWWMIITSFKSYGDYNAEVVPTLIAVSPTVENFIKVFTDVPLARYILNTVIYSVSTTALMLVISIPAAFAFARLDFRGKDILFTLFLALMMIPSELVIITNFVTVTELNLRNTFTGLILPSASSVFYVYLLKESFSAVPNELYLAAKVDGTSDLKFMLKVMTPVCKPTVITVTLLKLIECWNAYVWPRLITDEETHFLVSNGIQQLRESGFGRENVPAMMAAVVVISVPLILLFLIFRGRIMEGVARGGSKG
ncbi:MAG: carbohydrate ABC transporter permease [Clostridia bacterium]|nr:carbohydrate ABC transporter permease [Clostridia bacterium]MBQ2738489.1 carbohydrate ABC transporter permease [Clostridia bacterium]MBQ8290746.1 carbohydrate ABC transporter permease [Clostridia bacterium]